MISFFGESCLKAAMVERVKEHQRLDQIIQCTYWDGARGCAIGCVLHSSDHMAYETQLGLPVFLAYMDEHIFERLPYTEAKGWPLRFIEAVPVGVDLELVFPRFMHWFLSNPDGIRRYADARTTTIIDGLVMMYARRIDGIPFDIEAARVAAEAGRAAARAAAWSAAGGAEAAWSAAGAAEAADAAVFDIEAAEEAARAAAGAARVAAWSAVGGAAEAASIRRQADYLIMLLQSYESTPVPDALPCAERILMQRES